MGRRGEEPVIVVGIVPGDGPPIGRYRDMEFDAVLRVCGEAFAAWHEAHPEEDP